MAREQLNEWQQFRRSFSGQLKNIVALLCIPTGLFFWFRDRNLVLAIPMAVLAPLALNAPAFIYKKVSWLHERYNLKLLQTYEYCLILMIIFSVSGSAYLFYLHYQFDILVHYTENFIIAFLLVLGLNIRRERKSQPDFSAKKAAWLIFIFGVCFALGWELYQVACDHFFHTKMAFDSFQSWLDDTLSDMAGGVLGLLVFTPLIILPFWDYLNSLIRRGQGISR